jgi:hypothetical protein
MKFLCVECDQPMKLLRTEGPDEGSLAVTFGCPGCGRRIAMLTNTFETQLVKSLGVRVGGRVDPPAPFEHLRASLAHQRDGALEEAALTAGTTGEETPAGQAGPGCPFADMLAGAETDGPGVIGWSPEAEARVDRIPSFIRPMARKAIERYAEGKGYGLITEAVMDEAKTALGM